MKKRDLYLVTVILFIALFLIQLFKFILRPEGDTLNSISYGLLGLGIAFLLFAIFKKEKK